ncbi:MAG: alpha/beta hydrolase [Thermomicrobiales bacterium]|nr:alpha/beta hydrolase [Thermomicrobiales bacterium]
MTEKARTFVLVHGSWHGGWCWGRLAPLLEARGHRVLAPSLTGHADRRHLLSPAVGLSTHVEDIASLMAFSEVEDAILVGHSYGGMVIAAVAARRAERIAGLVYLDAFVPEDGQACFDLALPAVADGIREEARRSGDGWRSPPPAPQAMGIIDDDDARWVASQMTPQPIATFEQPVRFGAAAPDPGLAPRMYIHCRTDPPSPMFAPFADRARATPGWTLHELATGHDAMLTAPDDLARLLLAANMPGEAALSADT